MSGGDLLAYLFHKSGLGKLIGTRTMGSMVGVGGVNIPFLDGGSSLPPNVGFYDSKGKSVVEGYGVEPDIRIPDDPAQMMDGQDPQLGTAIHRMMDTLQRRTPAAPPRPPSNAQRRRK